MTRFVGKVAVVTGGVSGIGEAVAMRLAREGAKVAVWDMAPAGGAHVAHAETPDMADAAAVERAAAATVAALGGIDILVASAGITGPNTTVRDYPVAEWKRVIDVNLNGVFHCDRAVIPFMESRPWGRIVNIASIAGKGRQSERVRLFRVQGGGDRADEIARKGTREDVDHGELRHAGGGADADLRPDDPAAYRLHAVQDPDRAIRHDGGDRRADLLAGERGGVLLHGCGVRLLGRTGDILTIMEPGREKLDSRAAAVLREIVEQYVATGGAGGVADVVATIADRAVAGDDP